MRPALLLFVVAALALASSTALAAGEHQLGRVGLRAAAGEPTGDARLLTAADVVLSLCPFTEACAFVEAGGSWTLSQEGADVFPATDEWVPASFQLRTRDGGLGVHTSIGARYLLALDALELSFAGVAGVRLTDATRFDATVQDDSGALAPQGSSEFSRDVYGALEIAAEVELLPRVRVRAALRPLRAGWRWGGRSTSDPGGVNVVVDDGPYARLSLSPAITALLCF